MKKILIKTALTLILVALITCLIGTGTLGEGPKEIRPRYDSKITIFWDFITSFRLEDSVEYYEWTEYKEGSPILRIKIEGEFIRGYKTFIDLSFDEETGQEESNIVTRKIVTEAGVRKVVVSKSDFQRSFAGIITVIQYLRTHELRVKEKHKVNVITNKEEKLQLFLEIEEEENIKIGDFQSQVYVIKITVTDKTGDEMPKGVEIWFIKEGKLAGYIAKFKMSGMAFAKCLRLTLSSVNSP